MTSSRSEPGYMVPLSSSSESSLSEASDTEGDVAKLEYQSRMEKLFLEGSAKDLEEFLDNTSDVEELADTWWETSDIEIRHREKTESMSSYGDKCHAVFAKLQAQLHREDPAAYEKDTRRHLKNVEELEQMDARMPVLIRLLSTLPDPEMANK